MNNPMMHFSNILKEKPDGWAFIKGSNKYPTIMGNIRLYNSENGVFVIIEVNGLPKGHTSCDNPIFAVHIHQGDGCMEQQGADAFPETGTHYNPHDCPHPYHSGDMPPLFGADGYGFSAFLTNRFTVDEIIGKTVIIHSMPDDFTTQPSGNSGEKIACGVIKRR